MKFHHLRSYHQTLNTGGIAHLVVPLVIVVAVAAVGTYMLVASHANPLPKKPTYGYILAYGSYANDDQTTHYNRLIIKSGSSASTNKPKCGPKALTKNAYRNIALNPKTAVKLKCSPASYKLYFLTSKQGIKDIAKAKSAPLNLKAGKCYSANFGSVDDGSSFTIDSKGKCITTLDGGGGTSIAP